MGREGFFERSKPTGHSGGNRQDRTGPGLKEGMKGKKGRRGKGEFFSTQKKFWMGEERKKSMRGREKNFGGRLKQIETVVKKPNRKECHEG